MAAATRIEAMIVVPPTHLWVEVFTAMWLHQTQYVPLSGEDAKALRLRGITRYATTGEWK